MPIFTTATPAGGGVAGRRRARLSGQRSLPSVVEPRPSVMESPSVTTPLLRLSAKTSTPVMMYQWAVLAAPAMFAALTALVARRNDVVREPGWPLMVVADILPK